MLLAAFWTLAMTQIPTHVATTPIDRMNEDWWKQRHEHAIQVTKEANFDVAFLGDSITQGWEGDGKATWDKEIAPFKAANFGFSGDRTEHVLWRLEHGELMGTHPKLIVIMIGTNNIGHGSSNPTQTNDGVRAIVDKLHKGIPAAKILLLGIFPRGGASDDPMRVKVGEATKLFSTLGDDKTVFFRDIGYAFTRHDGTLRNAIMPDYLHLNPDGYQVWWKAIAPDFVKLAK